MSHLSLKWLPEAIRFAVASVVFYFVQPRLPDTHPWFVDQAISLGAAAVAFVLTAALLEFVSGAPTVNLVWAVASQRVHEASTTLDFSGTTATYAISVSVEFEGGTLLSRYVMWRSRSDPPSIRISILPADLLYFANARFPPGVSLANSVLTFRLASGFIDGPLQKAEFFATERNLPLGTSPLRCHVAFPRSENKPYALLLVRKNSELKTFEVRK